jgi:ABC-type amino acid transport substrate-binding protein
MRRILGATDLLVLAGYLIFTTVFMGLFTACAAEPTTWSRIQDNGVIRVGLDPTFPPFEFTDGETLMGIDVDIAEAIAADLNLEVTYSHFGYDGLYDALATGQVDVLISALVPDLTRTQDFAYSDGYINSGLVLVSALDSSFSDYTELAGKKVGVELGTVGHVEATNWQRQVPGLRVSVYQDLDVALSALSKGQVDSVIADNISARLFEGRFAEPAFAITPVSDEPYAMVVRREDSRLLVELNGSLSRIDDNGLLDMILNRWLQG